MILEFPDGVMVLDIAMHIGVTGERILDDRVYSVVMPTQPLKHTLALVSNALVKVFSYDTAVRK